MNKKESIWAQMNTKVLIPGVVIMLVFVVAGILAPGASYQMSCQNDLRKERLYHKTKERYIPIIPSIMKNHLK